MRMPLPCFIFKGQSVPHVFPCCPACFSCWCAYASIRPSFKRFLNAARSWGPVPPNRCSSYRGDASATVGVTFISPIMIHPMGAMDCSFIQWSLNFPSNSARKSTLSCLSHACPKHPCAWFATRNASEYDPLSAVRQGVRISGGHGIGG